MTKITGPKPPTTPLLAARAPEPRPAPSPASEPWTARPRPLPATSTGSAKVDLGLAASDAQALYSAMHGGLTGAGTDEARLFDVLAARAPQHLDEVKRVYAEHYGKSLDAELRSELSGTDLHRAEALLGGDPVQAQVEQLRAATTGLFGAHTKQLLATLEALPPEAAKAVGERFSAQFGSLEAAVSGSLSGPSRDEALALLRGDRPAAWAARLDSALNVTHQPVAALEVLKRTDPASIRTLTKAYEARAGRPLEADLSTGLKGTERDLGVALVKGDALGADVARLRHAVEGRFFGLGKDATAALAVLEGQPPEGRPALEAAYEKKYGASIRQDVVQRFGGREGERLGRALDGRLDDVERLQIAVKGWGADEKAIDRVLGGRSKESVTQLAADFEARTGEPLDAMLSRELSGRARFDARLALEGPPATPEEAVDQARRRRDFEREGTWNTASRLVMDRVSGSGKRLDGAVTEAEATLKRAQADGRIDALELARLQELTGRASGETLTYRETKDATAEAAATAAAVAATVATAGAGAPLLVGAAAGATAKVATKAALSGQAYSGEAAVRDGATGVIEGLTGNIGGVAAGRAATLVGGAATTVMGKAAQGAVAGAVGGFLQGATGTALKDETWNSGVAEGLFAAGKTGAKSAATSAALGASSALTAELRHPTMNNVVATKFPGEKKPIDLSKYTADKATRDAAKKSLEPWDLKEKQVIAKILKEDHPELAKIPTDDLIGLRVYTENGYVGMNSALRGKTADLEKLGPLVKTAASGLNELPAHTGTVYRGAKLDPARIAKYGVGKVITEPGFMSTTTAKSVALGKGAGAQFGGNSVFVIKSKGAGRAVASLSRFPDEKEVLFGPGTEFKVLKNAFDKKLSKHLIYLQEVP